MDFIFHDENGGEVRVTDRALFARLVSEGKIKHDTLLFDARASLWKRAWEFEDYQAALSAINSGQAGYETAPSYGAYIPGASQSGSILFGQPVVEEKSERLWALGLSLLLFFSGIALELYVGIKYTSAYRAGYRLGILMGGSLWIALLAFLIWRFALNKSKGMGALMFAGGFMALSIILSAAAYREGVTTQFATEDMAAALKQMMSGGQLPAQDFDETKYGEMAPMVKIISEYAREEQSDMIAMNKEMEDLHLDTLLLRETLGNADGIAGGKNKLQMLREIFDRYETRLTERAENIPNKVAASSMDESQKREFISGFNASKEQGLRNISEFFAIERSFASKTEELYDFMRKRQGRYKFVGDQPVFGSQSDVRVYNQYITEINEIARQESDWRMRTQSRTQEKIDEFQKKMKQR